MSFIRVVKGFLPRILFVVHSFIAIWRLQSVMGRGYWFLMLAVLGLIAETGVMIKRKGREYKWFCPSYLFYLASVVPPIWLLELNRLDRYRSHNGTVFDTEEQRLEDVFGAGVEIPVQFSGDLWVLILEQVLLFLLIIGRWLLPKGEITRGQLSQLLFVYIGLGSDIMEFLVLFEEQKVVLDEMLSYLILIAWTVSLLQFTLVLTATKARKDRVIHVNPWDEPEDPEEASCLCCETEIWSIMTTVILQDGPFLSLRIYTMYWHKVFTNTILFFTFKNALVILIQFYRLIVLCLEARQEHKSKIKEKEHVKNSLAFTGPFLRDSSLSNLSTVMVSPVDEKMKPSGETQLEITTDSGSTLTKRTTGKNSDEKLQPNQNNNGSSRQQPTGKTKQSSKSKQPVKKAPKQKYIGRQKRKQKDKQYIAPVLRNNAQILAVSGMPRPQSSSSLQQSSQNSSQASDIDNT